MEHGIITTTNYEQGVVLCNVQAVRIDTEYRNVPMLKPFAALSVVPSIGQRVSMVKLGDGTRFITDVLARTEEGTQPDDLADGDVAIQLDEETKLTFTKTDEGNYDVDLTASGDVTVSAQGDATINAANHLQLSGNTIDFDTSGN